jgi:hypothetical protein
VTIDLQPLVDRFYDYFLDLYHQQNAPSSAGAHADTAKPGQPFLAFGNIGAAITPEMFRLQDGSTSVALVVEQFSGLANLLPELDGTSIASPGLLSADGAYGAMLAQARPLTADDLPGLGGVKGPAELAFDQASELPLIHGGTEYRPALPIPPDWPLPSGDAAWASYNYTTEQKTSITAPSPPPTPGVPRPNVLWRWRIAPPALMGSVKSVAAVATSIPPPPPPAPSAAVVDRVAVLHTPFVRAQPARATVAAPLHLATAARAMMDVGLAERSELPPRPMPIKAPPIIIRSQVLQAQLQEVRAQSQPQAVTSTSMELSFRYCLVTARRPWISGAFLTARNWFIPRIRAGEIASGTGLGQGSFEVMPTAALCVRDLTIKAAWSAEERAVLPAMTKFGPFSLVGSKLDAASTSLICPGTQIVGWVMEPMPKLPPNSDPSLPAV